MLSEPDWLEFTLPEKHFCVLTDDGSTITTHLAQALTAEGWPVIILSFPESLVPHCSLLPDGIPRIELIDRSENELQQKLAQIETDYGSIAALIHLHPRLPFRSNGAIAYLDNDVALIKQVFLLAKYLKVSLNQGDGSGRKCFLNVVRLDGAFGLSQGTDFSPIGAGLFGLTKSLNHEWPDVFCRAIDLSPSLGVESSVQAILAELHDPNLSIAEVAYGQQGRTTLVCEPTT